MTKRRKTPRQCEPARGFSAVDRAKPQNLTPGRTWPASHHAAHASHSAHTTHVRHAAAGFLVFRLVCNHRLGGDDQRRDRSRSLQCRAGYLGRIQDTHLQHVAVFFSGSVITVGALAFFYLGHYNGRFTTGVEYDLTQRSFHGTTQDVNTGLLLFVDGINLVQRSDSADQGYTTTGYDAFFNGSAGRVQRVFNASLLLFHFHFRTGTDLDDGNTASQLGYALLQLLFVVVRSAVFDLLADLLNAGFDVALGTGTADNGGVFLGYVDTLGSTQVIQSGVLQSQAYFFGNHSTTGQDGDVLQHFLTTVTKARRLDGVDFNDATHVVHNQGCQRFAFDVFSDDLQRLARLGDSFQHRQQFADVGDFLVYQQDVRVIQFCRHVVLVVDEVRAQVTAVELHTFDYVQLVFQATAFFNSNNAFFTYTLHGVGNDAANCLVAVGRDSTNLGDVAAVVARSRHFTDGLYGFSGGFVDAALQVHRVHAGGYRLDTLAHNGLGQNGCGGGAVTGGFVGLGSNFLDHLGTHVFELVFQLDFLGYGNTVFGDSRRTERLFKKHVTAFRAQRYLYGVCQTISTCIPAFAGALTAFNVFCCHVFYSCSLRRG